MNHYVNIVIGVLICNKKKNVQFSWLIVIVYNQNFLLNTFLAITE